MKAVTNEEIKEIDRRALEEYGIPSLILMENAGLKVFQNIKNIYPDLKRKNIIIFAGSGNNGGDGFVVARHLFNFGVKVRVYTLTRFNRFKGEAKINLDIIYKMGVEVKEIDSIEIEEVQKFVHNSDLVIDAIFGTGLHGKISGLTAKLIDLINNSGKEVIAIDIPSGLNADNGNIEGVCITANYTITLALPKIGLLLFPGAKYTGKVITEDIGIPKILLENRDLKTNIITKEMVKSILPFRLAQGHKSTFGKVLMIAGSLGMTGAAYLASEAAIRSGTGLVFLGIPRSLNPIMEIKLTEVITLPLSETKKQSLSEECEEDIFKIMNNFSAMGIGPGISRQLETQRLVKKLIEKSSIPLVVDADAIYALHKDPIILKRIKSPVIITPHYGEMARLINKDIDYILNNQLAVVREVAYNLGVTVVLKGARTIISNDRGEAYINIGDNSGMATGGSGDVLTGIITSLIAQGVETLAAAVMGVYIHSLAGNFARQLKGERGMIASDILFQIPQAFLSLE